MTEKSPEGHPVTKMLVRYGVPVLILVFYITASLRFDYTPDSTYSTLVSLKNIGPESLWGSLLSIAHVLRIDMLTAAKVFSLLFSCFALLFSFLIANEVLHDHVLAFCVAMAVGMQSWLLQLAPSGSGVCLVLFLTLATIFFLLRNEYIIAAVFAGLASLVAWQGIGLLIILIADAFVNSVSKARSTKIIASIVLVYLGMILPWVLYGLYVGTMLLPNEIAMSSLPALVPQVAFEAVLLVGLMFVGIVLLAIRDRETLRLQTPLVLWMVLASFSHERMFILTLPLIVVYAFLATQQIAESVRLGNAYQIVAGVLVAGILAYNQFVVHPTFHFIMDERIAEASVMRVNAEWLKLNASDSDVVAAPAGCEGLVQYYAEKGIGGTESRYTISCDATVENAEQVFDPARDYPELIVKHYRVWKKK